MRRYVTAALVAAIIVTGGAQATASKPLTLVVDDDGAQCGQPDHRTIQAAVDAAEPGSVIKVCPGRYSESVTVDKPLTLKGSPDATEAVACFDSSPSQVSDADPALHAIVDGTGLPAQELFDLAADDITLEGFVLQGASGDPLPADFRLFRAAINTSDRFSGYTISHNLIRLNTVGIQLGSSGATTSRFDHNCLRSNGWGLATDERSLVNARIDHNATFRTQNNAFEPALGRIERVSFDHNDSRQDNTSYLIRNSSSTRIADNTVESSRLGIVVGGGAPNLGLEIIGNEIAVNPLLEVPPVGGGVQQGIAFVSPPPDQAPNTGVIVRANTVVGMRDGIVAAGAPNATRPSIIQSELSNNVTSDNLRDGIVLRGGNTANAVRGNLAERNGRFGIYAQCRTTLGDPPCATANTFEANQMFGNASLDARDDARQLNLWIGNRCSTDFPEGTICASDASTSSGALPATP